MAEAETLFVAERGNPLKTAKELQLTIGAARSTEVAATMASLALDILEDFQTIHGSQKLLFHAMRAYVDTTKLSKGRSYDLGPIFDADMVGWFGGFSCKIDDTFRSLCLNFYEIEILRPEQLTHAHRRLPLLVPVDSLSNLWPMQ